MNLRLNSKNQSQFTLYDRTRDGKVMRGSISLNKIKKLKTEEHFAHRKLSEIEDSKIKSKVQTPNELFLRRQGAIKGDIQPLKQEKLQRKINIDNKLLYRTLSGLMLFISILGMTYVGLPVLAAEVNSRWSKPISVPNPIFLLNPVSETISSEATPIPTPVPTPKVIDWNDYRLYIPKIGVQSQIVANVDPNSPSEYQEVLLANGVAHARGSYLPSEQGPVLLFAHSTDTIANIARFNAKFFAAKELTIGDDIYIDFDHQQYRYQVVDTKVINPRDLHLVQDTDADLILSTCYPPGTDWQRLIIFAKKVV